MDIDDYHDDSGNMDGILLSTTARNNLMKDQKKKQVKGVEAHKRVEKSQYSTYNKAIDSEAGEILFKWENAGIITDLYGIIGNGKEAVVLPAHGYIEDTEYEVDYAIKIFKTTLTEFKNRKEYVESDERYADINLHKLNSKKMINLWAEKEYRNLCRLYNNGINCPKPYKFKNNIVLMGFIGTELKPAKQLKVYLNI